MPVLVTPTTKMFVKEVESIGPTLASKDRNGLRSEVAEILDNEGAVVVGSSILSKKRLGGIEPSWLPSLAPEEGLHSSRPMVLAAGRSKVPKRTSLSSPKGQLWWSP